MFGKAIDIWALGVGGDVALGRSVPLRGGGRVDYAAGVGVAGLGQLVILTVIVPDLMLIL